MAHASPTTTTSRSERRAAARAEQAELKTESQLRGFRPAEDVYHRVKHDLSLDSTCFSVGYLGLDPETKIRVVLECDFDAFDPAIVPMHCIKYYRYLGRLVWDREKQIDRVFGSATRRQQRSGAPLEALTIEQVIAAESAAADADALAGGDGDDDDEEEGDASAAPVFVFPGNRAVAVSSHGDVGSVPGSAGVVLRGAAAASSIPPAAAESASAQRAAEAKTAFDAKIDAQVAALLPTFKFPKRGTNRPNLFVGLRVDNEQIVHQIRAVQAQMTADAPHLRAIMYPAEHAHITFCVLRAGDASELRNAIAVFAEFGPVLQTWLDEMVDFEFQVAGMSAFNTKTAFADLTPGEELDDLTALQSKLSAFLAARGVRGLDNRRAWAPHVSVVRTALVSQLTRAALREISPEKSLQKELRSVPKKLWEPHAAAKFGNQKFAQLELLAMSGNGLALQADGYYARLGDPIPRPRAAAAADV